MKTPLSLASLARTAFSGPLFATSLLLVLGFASPAQAQSEKSTTRARWQETQARTRATKLDAYANFKSGDFAGGLAKLDAGLDRTARAKDADLQLGIQLASIAHRLKGDNAHARAVEAATLSLQRLAQSRPKQKSSEVGSTLVLAGQLYDYILGDSARAQQLYAQALELNPKNTTAAARLQFLTATENLAQEKAAENEAIRQRAAAAATLRR